MKTAILVTHLLGSGHLARASQIADALVEAGHRALVMSGGVPVAHAAPKRAELVQLPPIKADGEGFTALLDEHGAPATSALHSARRRRIAEALQKLDPDILLTELFPFGRRKLADEFESAIACARHLNPRVRIVCSIRDILQLPRKAGRKEEAEARFRSSFDAALFHGDPALVPLSASWPLPEDLQARIQPTGYIGEATISPTQSEDGHGEILVAAGGGAVGDALFEAALGAAALDPSLRWRLLVGGQSKAERIGKLEALRSAPNVVIEGTRPDFRALLERADAAILQAGYNTAMDVAASNVRTLFCPFEGSAGETEQLTRARAFAERFGSGLIRERDLSPQRLLASLQGVLAGPRPDLQISLGGAGFCPAILERVHIGSAS